MNSRDYDAEARQLIVDRIRILCQQETLYYSPTIGCSWRTQLNPTEQDVIDTLIEWRTKMINYCYEIIDFCGMSHESIVVAISYIDRFVFGPPPRVCESISLSPSSSRVPEFRLLAMSDGKVFQLLAIASLYTAIKITERIPLDLETISSLTHNTFTSIQLQETESIILEALNWYLHPPTAATFVKEMTDLINLLGLRDFRNDTTFFDLTSRQLDIATKQPEWIGIKPSYITYSAITNAMRIMCIPKSQLDEIEFVLRQLLTIDQQHQTNTLLPIQRPFQSFLVLNSRIEIRQVTSQEEEQIEGKYDEIDVVWEEIGDSCSSLTASSSSTTVDETDSTATSNDESSVETQERPHQLCTDSLSISEIQTILYGQIAAKKGLVSNNRQNRDNEDDDNVKNMLSNLVISSPVCCSGIRHATQFKIIGYSDIL